MTLREQFEQERPNVINGFTFGYTEREYSAWLESKLSTHTATPEPIKSLTEEEIDKWYQGYLRSCKYMEETGSLILLEQFQNHLLTKEFINQDAEHSPEVMANVTDGKVELTEYIEKVHEALEGRYTLNGEDLHMIHGLLCELQKPTPEPLKSKDKILADCLEKHSNNLPFNTNDAIYEAMQIYADQFKKGETK